MLFGSRSGLAGRASIGRVKTVRQSESLRRLAILMLLLTAATGILRAQAAPSNQPAVHVKARPLPPKTAAVQPPKPATPKKTAPNTVPEFHRIVNMVLVPVTITDPLGRLVTGLDASQFRVFENHVKQRIVSFSTADTPISVGIIFDVSGSMSDKINKSRAAVRAFLNTANPRDQFFVIAFSNEPHLICDFSSNINKIEGRLDFLPAGGRTALLDSIYLGLEKMRYARFARKALLIISDGGDNHSRYTSGEVRNAVRESSVQIYSIGVFDPVNDRSTPEERNGPELLSEICDTSGGRLFALDDLDELPDVASKIGVALRNEYLLGYNPSDPAADGKWRHIEVKLNPPPGLPPLSIHAKEGYYAPGPR